MTNFQGAKSPIDNLFVPRSQVANYIAAGWSGFSAINQDSKTAYDYAGFTTNISDLALAYTVTDPTAKTVELVPGYGIGGIDHDFQSERGWWNCGANGTSSGNCQN